MPELKVAHLGEHIKLPHYVDFQSELELVRKLRRAAGADDMPQAAE